MDTPKTGGEFAALAGSATLPWSEEKPRTEAWWRWTDDENGETVVSVVKTRGEMYQRWDIVINGKKVMEELQPCRLCIGRWAGPYDSREAALAESSPNDKRSRNGMLRGGRNFQQPTN